MAIYQYYDFFAGGGMVGYGLGSNWSCQFANDIDARKGWAYRANHDGGAELLVADVNEIAVSNLPGRVDLAWASFPCQDLSLAGAGAGLIGQRSGTFWPFWSLVRDLRNEDRHPQLIVLENVYGAVTSHGGRDFAAISNALSEGGYRLGAMVVDAVHFIPQSRPRLFIIGVLEEMLLPANLVGSVPSSQWHPTALIDALSLFSDAVKQNWIWWNLRLPPSHNIGLSSCLEDKPKGVRWHTEEETRYLLGLMSERNLRKVQHAKGLGKRIAGTVYRRTRPDGQGGRHQRAEVRFDDIAGCLRTPSGGSSRQTILIVDGDRVRSRLLSPREAVRLMGLPDEYELPSRYNDAYHLAGDGVVVPVVKFLAEEILEPILAFNQQRYAA